MNSKVLPHDSISGSSSSSQHSFTELWENKLEILQTIIEESEDAIFAKDRQGRYLIINSAGAKAAHRNITEMIGCTDADIFSVPLATEIRADDLAVINSGQTLTFENILALDASTSIYHSIKSPYRNGQGEVDGIVGIARNITALKRAEIGHRLLAKIGEVLSTSLDYKVRLSRLAQLAVPHLADWCSVDVLSQDGSVQRVAMAHIDPAKVELANQLYQRYPPNWDEPVGAANVLRTGRAELYPQITEEMIEAAACNKEHLQTLQTFQMRSAMAVPLTARDKTFGVMTFVWSESERHYDADDLVLAEEIARRAAIAIDNARLYKAEKDARRVAELTAERMTSLQMVTTALSAAVTSVEVAKAVIDQGLDIFKAASGLIVLLNEATNQLEIVHSFGYVPERVNFWRQFPLSANVPLAEAVRVGQPVFVQNLDDLSDTYPELVQHRDPTHHSLAALPLLVENKAIGGIGLSFTEPHTFSPETQQFLAAIARQCAQALDKARLYEAEKKARTQAEVAHQRLAVMSEVNERNRLAQELHDTVAQALGYLNLKMSMAINSLGEGQIETIEESLKELKQIIGETYTDVREEIFNLRSTTVLGVQFLDTLQEYVDKYKRFYRLDVQLVKNGDISKFEFSDEVGIQLVRTIQEALINVRKHAQVDQAVINLSQEDDRISITIEDKGQGFNLQETDQLNGSSFGLQIMQERIDKIGGSLEVESKPGRGTRIKLHYRRNGKSH